MEKIKFVINGRNEMILYSSLKKELKKEGINLSIRKLKELGYRIVELSPIAFL